MAVSAPVNLPIRAMVLVRDAGDFQPAHRVRVCSIGPAVFLSRFKGALQIGAATDLLFSFTDVPTP